MYIVYNSFIMHHRFDACSVLYVYQPTVSKRRNVCTRGRDGTLPLSFVTLNKFVKVYAASASHAESFAIFENG